MNAETKIVRADNVHTRLSTARQMFHATELKKTGWNSYAEYKYFELGDFLIPALAIFHEVGLSGLVSFTADVATLEIFNLDNLSECIRITSPMGSAKLKACHEVQNIGAVETYQRRYLWTAALEIVEHDALEATTAQIGKEPETSPDIISDAEWALLTQLVDSTKTDAGAMCTAYDIDSLKDMNTVQFKEVKAILEKRLAKMAKEATDA